MPRKVRSPAPRLRRDGQPDGRYTRWEGLTPEQRRAETRPATAATIRAARDRRIARLVAEAPELTPEQRARLAVLLDVGTDGGNA